MRQDVVLLLLGLVSGLNTVPFAVVQGLQAQTTVRHVDCDNAHQVINDTIRDWYEIGFTEFEEIPARSGKWTLIFESIASLANVASGGADLMEFMVTLKRIEQAVAPSNVTVQQVMHIWQSEWSSLAEAVEADGQEYFDSGDAASAASAYLRAWNYYMTAERLSNHLAQSSLKLYNSSLSCFEQALNLTNSPCQLVQIPYSEQGSAYSLHGYMCEANSQEAAKGTILLMTGYDGTAELLLHSVGLEAVHRGYNVLAFEGPGQGSVSRFQGLHFRPDWEVVVSQVVEWLLHTYSEAFNEQSFILWGRSFGGYLAPKAFAANQRRYSVLIADGGMYDFYQVALCSLPESLRDLWYQDRDSFSNKLSSLQNYSLSLKSFLAFGELGFGSSEPKDIYLSAQSFWLEKNISGINARPVLVNDPALDSIAGNQSMIFYSQLPRPLSNHTEVLNLNPKRGAGLHCGVGSNSYTLNAEISWLDSVMKEIEI